LKASNKRFYNFSTVLCFLDLSRQLNEPSSRIVLTNCGHSFEK